jgi:hypothetical protein
MRAHLLKRLFAGIATIMALAATLGLASAGQESASESNQVLEWNQIFVDTLVATNTPNSSSQRLGAIVHTAIFDAYNGVEGRYTPIFVSNTAPPGASRRAAVIAAAYTALLSLFPSRQPELDASYAASIEALGDDDGDGGKSHERGIAWGIEVASAVLAWRGGRPLAAIASGVRIDERAGVGIHFTVCRGEQHAVSAGPAPTAEQQHVHR